MDENLKVQTDKYLSNLRRHIKEGRSKMKLSQAELAQKVGCSEKTIWSIEKGVANPRLDLLYEISSVIDVCITTLVCGDESIEA